jgi:hypothetical protein
LAPPAQQQHHDQRAAEHHGQRQVVGRAPDPVPREHGGLLRPRALVGLRGAGWSHDGLWYVRKVSHDLSRGSYRQSFTLAREGYGSTLPAVVV